MVKIFLEKLTTCRDGPVKGTETRQGWKHKKTILLKKIMVKEDWKISYTSLISVKNNPCWRFN